MTVLYIFYIIFSIVERCLLQRVTAELKIVNVAIFQRKTKLFGFSACPDG